MECGGEVLFEELRVARARCEQLRADGRLVQEELRREQDDHQQKIEGKQVRAELSAQKVARAGRQVKFIK